MTKNDKDPNKNKP